MLPDIGAVLVAREIFAAQRGNSGHPHRDPDRLGDGGRTPYRVGTGALDCITKPLGPRDLADRVNRLFRSGLGQG